MFFQCVLCLIVAAPAIEDFDQRLVEAVRKEDAIAVQQLLQCGADPNAQTEPQYYGSAVDFPGVPVLHLAVKACNLQIVELLLKEGADTESLNDFSETPLMEAVRCKSPALVEAFLNHGAKINRFNDENQYCALMLAAIQDNAEVAKFLIHSGAEACLENQHCWNAVMVAKLKGNYVLLDFLESRHIGLNDDQFKKVEFFRKIRDCDMTAIRELVAESRSLLKEKNYLGTSPIGVATEAGCTSLVQLLVDLGGNINDGAGCQNPLTLAVLSKNKEMINCLLDLGINPNDKPCDGNSPLHTALYAQDPEVAHILIEYDADVNAKNHLDMTPINMASFLGYTDLVQVMLAKGADPWQKDKADLDAINCALKKGHLEIVKMILETQRPETQN